MRRREFFTLAGGVAVTWPLAARAQQTNEIARIGYLSQESAAFDRSHGDSAAFRDALGDLGYVEGKNLHIEFRYADADLDRLFFWASVSVIFGPSDDDLGAKANSASCPLCWTPAQALIDDIGQSCVLLAGRSGELSSWRSLFG